MGVNTLFLDTVWGPLGGPPYGELRAFKKGTDDKVQAFKKNTTDAQHEAVMLSAVDRMDVYFGVLPRVETKGTAESCVDTTDLIWADFDAKSYMGKTGAASAFSEISHMRLVPQIVVDSGNGYHAYWLLDQDYPFADAQKVMKGIEYVHHSDHCSDQARILRVPGTLNFKGEFPKPVRLIRFDVFSPRYSLDSFFEYHYRDSMTKKPAQSYNGSGDWTPSKEDAPKFGEGERNHGMMSLAGAMVHKGLAPHDVVLNLMMENQLRCDPPLEDGEVLTIAKSAERYR